MCSCLRWLCRIEFEVPTPGSIYALDLDFSFFCCAVFERPVDEA